MNHLQNPYLPIIQQSILKLLKKGIIPWRQGFSPYGVARTYTDQRYINGISWLLCNFTTDYSLPYYLSWKHVQQLGGQIQKNTKAEFIYYSTPKQIKRFPIYNISSIKGIDIAIQQRTLEEQLVYDKVDKWLTPLLHKIPTDKTLNRIPHWDTAKEVLKLPVRKKHSPAYYWHLFKALIAWTGSERQLNRTSPSKLLCRYPTGFYQEQLVCELGAAYLCGYFGIYAPWHMETHQEELLDWSYYIYRYPELLMVGVLEMREAVGYLFRICHYRSNE